MSFVFEVDIDKDLVRCDAVVSETDIQRTEVEVQLAQMEVEPVSVKYQEIWPSFGSRKLARTELSF